MNSKTRLLLIVFPLALAACGVGAPPTQQPPTQAPPTAAPPTSPPPPNDPEPTNPGSTDPASINGRQFISVDVSGHTLVPGTTIRLTFTDGSLGAQAGCNSIGGTFTIVDGKI